MVGRGSMAVALAALLLGVGAASAAAQDGLRLQMVYNEDPAQITALEKQYDVGYIGERTEAAVYLDDNSEALLRAQGYTIGQVVHDEADSQARRAEPLYAQLWRTRTGPSRFARSRANRIRRRPRRWRPPARRSSLATPTAARR